MDTEINQENISQPEIPVNQESNTSENETSQPENEEEEQAPEIHATEGEDQLTNEDEVTTVVLDDPEAPTNPKTSVADTVISKYKSYMEKWSTVESQEQLFQLHLDAIGHATNGLGRDKRESIVQKLSSYFMYISDLFEEETGTPVSSPPLCIYFTKKDITMGIYTSQSVPVGSANMDVGFSSTRLSVSYPSRIMSSGDQLLANILKAGKQYDHKNPEKLPKEQQTINELLKWIKNYADKYGRVFEQTIIVIPTWFQAEHRMVLRNSAHLAQFTKCYLLTDASLSAINVLVKPLKEIPTVVVVTVGILGVEVGMYTILNRAAKMVALEKFEWELNESDMSSNGCQLVCLPISGSNKLRRAMESQDDPLRILKTTYTKAADQLTETFKKQKREIYFVSESASWEITFKAFMEENPTAGNWRSLSDNWVLSTAMDLSKSVSKGKLRKVVVDHVLPGDNDTDSVFFWK